MCSYDLMNKLALLSSVMFCVLCHRNNFLLKPTGGPKMLSSLELLAVNNDNISECLMIWMIAYVCNS